MWFQVDVWYKKFYLEKFSTYFLVVDVSWAQVWDDFFKDKSMILVYLISCFT